MRIEIKKQRAYTLIEVLISVAIFFTVIVGPTGLFIFSLKNQNRILSTREIVDNSSHVFEYMSRALRMARKELDCEFRDDPESCACLQDAGYGFNYEITLHGKGIKFNTSQHPSVCQEFFWDTTDNRLKESKNGSDPVPLTSDDLEVISFKFKESGFNQDDNDQPRVVIFLEITKKNQTQAPKIKIQTVISQRNLDVRY
ncbi:MAG: PilW family protein [Candidatus Nealsonbacteria bacterium]